VGIQDDAGSFGKDGIMRAPAGLDTLMTVIAGLNDKKMKLKNWIKYLVKPKFYLRPQPHFLIENCRQNIAVHLQSLEPYMPFPSVRRAAICVCLGLFLAIPVAAFSQTNYAPDGTQYAIIGSLPGDQIYPDIALNAQGGYVVWQDNITDPVGEGISAMQLNSTLSGSGDIFQVNVTSTNDQQNARVALLKKGGAAFVWQGGPDNQQHIYGRFLNASNIWLNTTNVLLSTYTNGFQCTPAIATLTNGNVVVVWSSFDQATSNSLYDVYGEMFATNGTRIGTNFLINVFTTYNQRSPAVAALPNGGFVVAWVSEQERSTAPDWGTNTTDLTAYGMGSALLASVDVYERLYTISGSNAVASTSEILVDQGVNPCAAPDIATAADGSYMVTWCANNVTNSNNGWDIYERSFTNANGGPIYLVNSYTYGDQYNPRISVIGDDYLIAWTSLGQDGSREGVYGQYMQEGDSPVGNEFLVNTTTVGQQMEPAVASDGFQQFLVVWTSFTFSPDSFDLFAQRYVNSGAVLEPMAAPFVWAPFVASNGAYQPELVVSWPPVQGLSVANYEVFVNGSASPMATVTNNQWTMTAANGLGESSTNLFALEYVLANGEISPMSPSTSGGTWSGCDDGGIPCEWMEEYYGQNLPSWPSINTPVVPGGPTLLQIFMSGGNPTNSATWLQTSLTKTSQGMFLNWNTQPGMTYQVQVTTDFVHWTNFGVARFESGTSDSIFLGSSSSGYYRVQLLWQ
jgi:hypothetical protein